MTTQSKAHDYPLFNHSLLRKRRQYRRLSSHYLSDDLCRGIAQRLIALKKIQNLSSVLFIGHTDFLDDQMTMNTHIKIPLSDFNENHPLAKAKGESFDLIIDCFLMHWLNDPVAYVQQIFTHLNSGGFYITAFPGGNTLTELRHALIHADAQIYGGAVPRVSPMITPEAMTRILQACGFIDTVVDHDPIIIEHKSLYAAHKELKEISESSCFFDKRNKPLLRTHLKYLEKKLKTSPHNTIENTFDALYGIAQRKA